jgi:putative polyketide hydroxylase
VWVEQEGKQISTWICSGVISWCDAAHAVSQQIAVPIDAYQFDLGTAYGLMPQGAVLVRPDGFVAWRAKDGSTDPAGMLLVAMRSVLDRMDW